MERLNAGEKIALSNARFAKSKEMLSDAVASFKAGMHKTSINRSYYAVLHCARSLLILEGVDPIRHDGVKTMLSLHFVKPKALPQDAVRIFKNLLSLRTDVDYGDFESTDRSDSESALRQARVFLKLAGGLRRSLIGELRGF